MAETMARRKNHVREWHADDRNASKQKIAPQIFSSAMFNSRDSSTAVAKTANKPTTTTIIFVDSGLQPIRGRALSS